MLGRLVLPSLLALALLAGCAAPADEPAATASSPSASPSSPRSTSPSASPLAPASASPGAEPAAPSVTVLDVAPLPEELATSILGGAFAEPIVRAPVGATITWRNLDASAHTVSSDDGTFAGSGPLAPGMAFSRTFLSAGEYAFHCALHPDMKGRVVIG